MYSKLHILVDRNSLRGRHASWVKCKEAVENGYSITFFPEGGISSKNPPELARFKEGSFKIAIDEQIPVVPVTIHNNHLLLPDKKPLMMHSGLISLKVHKPIWPNGNDDLAMQELKDKVRSVIEQELTQHHAGR